MISTQKLLSSALFLFFLILYTHNLSQGIYGGDVGDLVTAGYVFGLAHPPGYPLFSLLGFLFSHAIPISTIAFRVGLISVLASSLGVLFFFLTIHKLTKNTILSLLASLILGLNYLYWFYAEIAEVFALNNFFILLLLFLSISYYLEKRKVYFYLLAFFSGLSLTNHHTIVLLFPSFLILLFPELLHMLKKDKKAIIVAIGLSVLGFSAYGYVFFTSPIASPVNWKQVHDIPSFLHILLRKDYGTFSAGVFDKPNFLQTIIILQSYLGDVLRQLTIPVIMFCVVGLGYVLKWKTRLGISILLGFLLSGPIFVGYAGFPLYSSFNIGVYERFFLMSTVILLFFFPFGLVFLKEKLQPYFRKQSIYAIQLVFFIIPLFLFLYNFPKTNLSHVYIGDNLSKDILRPLPKNAILFLSGDSVLFNTWYIQQATQYRKDVTLININGVQASPYFMEVQKIFKKENPSIKNENKIANGAIRIMAEKKPIFSVQSFKVSDAHVWIPHGLTYKLVRKNQKPTENEFTTMTKNIWTHFSIPIRDINNKIYGSLTISEIPVIYSNALLTTGYYFFSEYKNEKTAQMYFEKARKVDNANPKVYSVLGTYLYSVKNNCNEAEKTFRKGIELNPFEQLNYYMLYSIAQTCYKDKNMQREIQAEYEKTFQSSFANDIKKQNKK